MFCKVAALNEPVSEHLPPANIWQNSGVTEPIYMQMTLFVLTVVMVTILYSKIAVY